MCEIKNMYAITCTTSVTIGGVVTRGVDYPKGGPVASRLQDLTPRHRVYTVQEVLRS